jgi:hypothetical protein
VMRSTWPSIRKEVRALGPVWLATVIAILAFQPRAAILHGFGAAVYFLGAAALGALSIGHEYTNRTLPFLLTVPARRGRLLLIKLGVLAVMLLTLCGVAGLTVFHSFEAWFALTALCLPVMYGLFVAPWLTMICRSPIAGTVFNVGIAGILLIVGERLGTARYGYTRDVDIVRMAVLWYGSIAVCVVGAVMSWRTFMSLEAIDDRGPELSWPTWLRQRPRTTAAAPAFTKQYPIWLLVKKELRLQQMSLAVPGLYLVGLFAVIPYTRPDPDNLAFALTIFYGGLIAVLIGSLASAEERALGTLPAQVLLPVSMRTQWAVKLTVVLALALVLALVLPVVVLQVLSRWHVTIPGLPLQLFWGSPTVVMIAMLAVGSLYVSSLCKSGLWAMIVSVPAVFGVFAVIRLVAFPAASVYRRVSQLSSGSTHPIYFYPSDGEILLLLAVVSVVVLRFALANHRSADQGRWRVWQQLGWVAFSFAGGFMLLGVLDGLVR